MYSVRSVLACLFAAITFVACDAPQPAPPRTGQPAQQPVASGPRSGSSSSAVHQSQVVEYYTISLDDVPESAQANTTQNWYFIVDGSGSMQGERLDKAKQGIISFLQNVPDDNNIGLLIFDDRGTREVVPLGTGNRDKFRAEVQAIVADGGTPLGVSISHAISQLKKQYKQQLGYGGYHVVVVTDGNSSDNAAGPAVELEKHGFVLYTIGFGGIQNHKLKQYSADYLTASDEAGLAKALTSIVAEPDDDWTPAD